MMLLTIVSSFSIIIFCVYAMLYTKKALYSIYYLIMAFITATVFLFYLGIEFIAILYVLLYLGAIVVLYIISIYTLGSNLIDDFERTSHFRFNWFVLPLLLFFIYFTYDQTASLIYFNGFQLYVFFPDYLDTLYQLNKNTDVLAFLIFDHYPLALLVGSLILLMAMVGAIILTLHYLEKKKK